MPKTKPKSKRKEGENCKGKPSGSGTVSEKRRELFKTRALNRELSNMSLEDKNVLKSKSGKRLVKLLTQEEIDAMLAESGKKKKKRVRKRKEVLTKHFLLAVLTKHKPPQVARSRKGRPVLTKHRPPQVASSWKGRPVLTKHRPQGLLSKQWWQTMRKSMLHPPNWKGALWTVSSEWHQLWLLGRSKNWSSRQDSSSRKKLRGLPEKLLESLNLTGMLPAPAAAAAPAQVFRTKKRKNWNTSKGLGDWFFWQKRTRQFFWQKRTCCIIQCFFWQKRSTGCDSTSEVSSEVEENQPAPDCCGLVQHDLPCKVQWSASTKCGGTPKTEQPWVRTLCFSPTADGGESKRSNLWLGNSQCLGRPSTSLGPKPV